MRIDDFNVKIVDRSIFICILLQNYIRRGANSNLIISVTKVYVTPDLSLAKIYISVFPSNKSLLVNKGKLVIAKNSSKTDRVCQKAFGSNFHQS